MAGLDTKALDRLSAAIQADIDNGRMYGASIIVARHGQIGLDKSYGFVTPDRQRKAADDDVYLLMSLSKSFTAALTLRAIDEGRYNLDTKVIEILPEFGSGGKQNVTVRHLLTHTAGTFPGFLPPGLSPQHLGDLDKFVDAISAQPISFIPGERCHYNSAATYAVLGKLLVATDPAKRTFKQIAREDLFQPLGMNDTEYGVARDHAKRVPSSFTKMMSDSTTPQMIAMMEGLCDGAEVPAGSAFSTKEDCFKFAEMMRMRGMHGGFRYISKALFDYAARNHTGALGNNAWDFNREAKGVKDFPANFSLLGGYVRGEGHFLTGAGHTASPETILAIGGGTTMWLVDPVRDLTVVFLSAGFIPGLAHMDRLRKISDLALAACN